MNETTPSLHADPTRRGFAGLCCLKCGEAGDITINLSDLTDDASVRCNNCDAEYSVEDARQTALAWLRVANWVALAPAIEE